jgi:hypothetical protein
VYAAVPREGIVTGPVRIPLAIAMPEQDQVRRLAAFRAAYPHVQIREGAGYWQAVITEDGGETIITRYELGTLLDRLTELCAGGSGE